MKFNQLILLSILSFFLLSCDSGLKFENPLEKNDSDSIEAETHDGDRDKTDTSAEQEDKDKTDTVSEYDDDKTDTASTNNGDSGDSKPDEDKTDSDNSDTAPEQPDNDDSAPEQPDDTDTAPDEDDFQPDDADSQSDDDADTSHGNEHETGDIREADCTGLPAHASWNTVSSISQTWSGNAWTPSNAGTYNETPSSTECHYKCNTGYHWENSACISNTRSANCTDLPENAEWNTASTIIQTWNGYEWEPTNIGSFDEAGSTSDCYFNCKEHYTWKNSICKADSKVVNCTEPPANAEWNTVSTISQTWNGSTWEPSNNTTFSEDATTNECHFKCAENYTWNDLECVGATRTQPCTGLPKNAVWNTAESIQQTWDGYDWSPSSTGVYNTTASTDFCRYQCDEYSRWENSKCVSPCDSEPCVSVKNSTGHCIAMDLDKYRCECENGYYWWGTSKGCINKPLTIGDICTGQTKCYNASFSMTCPSSSSADFFGQDAYYASLGKCTPQSFTVQTLSNQKVVVDNNTGLMWQQTIPTEQYTWDNADSYCGSLTYAGYSDWRMPTPQELLTIVDNSKYEPAIDTTYFPDTTPRGYFWSSSSQSDSTNYAWGVDFFFGSVSGNNKANDKYVRCVRGLTLPTNSFNSSTVNGDVIVTDTESGLVWQKTYTTNQTWQQALSYCESLTYAGYSDWRLPNKNELSSLINYEKNNPASDFPDMPSKHFWSSSTNACNGLAWNVGFYVGNVGHEAKTTSSYYYVHCVRYNPEEEFTRTVNCSSKPTNTVWNTVDTITQTYNGTDWEPSTKPHYNLEPSENECRYKCATGYDWNGYACTQRTCNPNPCTSIANSTGNCIETGTSYICECQSGYIWDGYCKKNFECFLHGSGGTPCYDQTNRLTWSEMASNYMDWQSAVDYCNSLNASNYLGFNSGWHLPTISELRTLIQNCPYTQMPPLTGSLSTCGIVDRCLSYSHCWTDVCYVCTSTGSHSKLTEAYTFWSSSALSDNTARAWDVDFEFGFVLDDFKTNGFYVRCARSE